MEKRKRGRVNRIHLYEKQTSNKSILLVAITERTEYSLQFLQEREESMDMV